MLTIPMRWKKKKLMRDINFSAGPAILPENALKQVQKDFLDWNNQGASIIEVPHRSEAAVSLLNAVKRDFRALWIQRINAGVREHGLSYSEFMGKVAKRNIELNRKALADLAMNSPEAFKAIVEKVK